MILYLLFLFVFGAGAFALGRYQSNIEHKKNYEEFIKIIDDSKRIISGVQKANNRLYCTNKKVAEYCQKLKEENLELKTKNVGDVE